ncbi:hypothetical protein Tco_0873540 [Tanacetum coccineum]|uniref:Uncharacterized protein n=1 Tax=Tanacetum coccineum TaxID=301880 RepID=A0ABQ5BN84_9ASTR
MEMELTTGLEDKVIGNPERKFQCRKVMNRAIGILYHDTVIRTRYFHFKTQASRVNLEEEKLAIFKSLNWTSSIQVSDLQRKWSVRGGAYSDTFKVLEETSINDS